MELEIENLPKSLQKRGLKGKIREICEKNDIMFMAVFGSFARGEQKKTSDLDIVIEFDKTKRKSLLDLIHAENELTKTFKRKVDLGLLHSLNPLVAEDVKKEMRIIYEKRQSLS